MWVLLHGFTGSPRSWDTVVSRAELEPPPARPALFGHAPGWRDLRVRSFTDEVERVCDLASRADTPRFLAGYSLGARVAAGMLATAPELFDGALLISVHSGLSDETARRARRQADEGRARLLEKEGLEEFVAAWENAAIFETQRRLPAIVRAEQREIRLAHDPAGLAGSLRALGLAEMPSYADALCASRVPTTVMAGGLDSKFRTLATELGTHCAELDVVVVEGAGHNLLLEASDAVAEQLGKLEQRVLGGAVS